MLPDRGQFIFAEQLLARLGPATREIVQEWFLTPAYSRKVLAAASWHELLDTYRQE